MTFNIILLAREAALRHFIEQLNEFLESKKFKAEAQYWVSTTGADALCCHACASEAADRMHAENDTIDHRVEGGWDHLREAEEPVYCDGCGKILAFSLPPQSAVDYIKTFIDHEVSFRGQILPDEAYEVHQVLMSLYDDCRFGDPDDIEGTSQDYRNAVTLGQMAVAAILDEPAQLDLFNGDQHGQEDIPPGERVSSAPDQTY